MRHGRLRIGVDVDDVLYVCNQHAIDMLCRDKNYLPLNINDISGWGATSKNALLDERIAYFSKVDFVENQPIIPGAKRFIEQLSKKGDVIFITAVGANCMSARAERLVKDFPMIPERNIMIGARKDLMNLDILLDDGAHNILGSSATYPVLFRRPWNNNITGLLSVNSYNAFLQLVDQINNQRTSSFDLSEGGVVCLVGPSGSGKAELVQQLLKDRRFARPVTTTTRAKRSNEGDEYNFISREDFENGQDKGLFLESTVYGGEYYGTHLQEIDRYVKANQIAVIPVDFCGAITLKAKYPKNCVIAFTHRSRNDVIGNILSKQCPENEKVLRILSLESEYRNEDICDLTVSMAQDPKKAAKELMAQLGLK